MQVPDEIRIPEVWYRPNLEDFDINYNNKHRQIVDRCAWAALKEGTEGWECVTTNGEAIITTETLYFP